MPRAVYEFKLPEEQEEFEEFQKAPSYRRALSDIWEKVRSKKKYETDRLSEGELKAYNQVYDWIGTLCSELDIEVP